MAGKVNGKLRTSREIAMNGGVRFKAAPPPYEMVNRGLSYGWANTLIKAAVPEDSRENPPLVDYDFHRTITSIGRRTLYSLARTMFWRIPPLQAAVLEQASLAANPFIPRFVGANTAWGEQASDWLDTWGMNCCIEGWPYDYDSYCEILVGEGIVDGEMGTLLTEDASGNARTQFIPTHRIGSRYQTGGICKVTYDGNRLFIDDILVDGSLPYSFAQKVEWTAPIVDGCIVDGQGRALAYRVYDDPVSSGKWMDISARSMFLSFFPHVAGQLHGISLLASSIYDWQDWREFKSFEQLAQKAFAAQTIVETNESGEADQTKAVIKSSATFDDNGAKTGLDVQSLQGGLYRYIKARSGGALEAFDWKDRPGRNAQEFQEMTLRDAMKGTEWDAFFSLDPKSVGGAPMRVIVDRINRVIRKRRKVLKKSVYRTHVYAIAKGIKNGDLPFDPEWFKWTYQGAPDVTADRRYDSQVDEMEYELGWLTLDDVESRRSGDWLRKREQIEKETYDLYARAKRISDKFGISIQEAANRISERGSQSFAMSRKEQGENALEDDAGNSDPVNQKNSKPKQGEQAASAPITLNIENHSASKRRIKFNRDFSGKVTGAEIEDQ